MDPRIRGRRTAVRREEGRHRLRMVAAMSALVVAGAGGWGATRSRLLDVDRIRVAGASKVSPDQVWAASGLRRGQPLIDVDTAAVTAAVERLPWVQKATARRDWPGTVTIRVTERAAVAVTEAAGGGFDLVDRSGQVMARADNAPAGLPVLTGLPPAGEPGTRLGPDGVATLSVAVALPGALSPLITGVSPGAGTAGEVELRLARGATVKLGPPEDLVMKLEAVAAVLTQVDTTNLDVLDVRRPTNPVITRRPGLTRPDGTAKVSTTRTG